MLTTSLLRGGLWGTQNHCHTSHHKLTDTCVPHPHPSIPGPGFLPVWVALPCPLESPGVLGACHLLTECGGLGADSTCPPRVIYIVLSDESGSEPPSTSRDLPLGNAIKDRGLWNPIPALPSPWWRGRGQKAGPAGDCDLSPRQDQEHQQASLVGTGGRAPGRARIPARHPLSRNATASQCDPLQLPQPD